MRLGLLSFVLVLGSSAALAQPSYYNFEAGQVRPVAISPDGTRLFVVNTPDDRLEIFDLRGALPAHVASVPVGLSPVAVQARDGSRVWVVNHLSDSVSIVDVAADPPRVVQTLLVGDEPNDVVFAGTAPRAFVTTAHRGQNHPVPRGDPNTAGIGRADVWVFDAMTPSATPISIVQLFGDKPRALAVSPDRRTVYAAVFQSGNRTTTINEGAVCNGGPDVETCSSGPGGLPPPMTSATGERAPEVGLIVRFDPATGRWVDELARDWSAAVRFDLPDEDVFAIDADTATATGTFASVGTVLFAMAVNPVSGALYVSNTEAPNEVRFEGPGRYVREMGLRAGQPATVRGHLHEARVTVIAGGTVAPHRLNPHIPYDDDVVPAGTRERSLSTPLGMAVSADGATLYVAGYGSSAIAVLDVAGLESGTVDSDASRLIRLDDPGPTGPTGMVLDESRGRLYVATRFDNSLVTVDVATRSVAARARLHTPEPATAIAGRPMLYDAFFTSSNGEAACGGCHIFGDLDGLAWDLGNPDGREDPNPNPIGPIGMAMPFHPMKGPMTTQSLRGMADHGPMHWRGDRTGGNAMPAGDPMDELAAFAEFDGAFEGLLGRAEGPLREEEMRRFGEFALGLIYPPNPIRQLDNSLRAEEERGRALYFEREGIDTISTCNGCHELDRGQGFFGGNGETTFENETQEFKVPHLRNAYQKVGMFGMAPAPFFTEGNNEHRGRQIRGFGFLHDGSTDTLDRFLHATVFNFGGESEMRDVEAFILAFDSTLPPIVGQQVTLDATSAAAVDARITLMIARARTPMIWPGGATTTECDLVVHGVVAGEARGWLMLADGTFRSDRASEPALADAALRAIGRAGALTYTCAPPGAGSRMALDRDEDGTFDRDELDAGGDPASRPFVAIPDPELPSAMPAMDGGVPSGDAGVDAGTPARTDGSRADAGATPPATPDDGCGCHTPGVAKTPGVIATAAVALLLGLLLAHRRRRSR
jgi:MYXO-CTERM domain-containing protein